MIQDPTKNPEPLSDERFRSKQFIWTIPPFSEADGLRVLVTQDTYGLYIGEEEYWSNNAARNITLTTARNNPEVSLSFWTWCSQDIIKSINPVDGLVGDGILYEDAVRKVTMDDEILTAYLDAITSFNNAGDINTNFVYVTAITDDPNGYYTATGGGALVNRCNDMIRERGLLKGGIIYDQADIENFNIDNTERRVELWNGQTLYLRHHDYDAEIIGHTTEQLCLKKMKAFWWMLARVAGWNGTPKALDTTAPLAPADLQESDISYNRVSLSWNSATDPESEISSYNIYRNNILLTQLTQTSFTDTNLDPETRYSYTVTGTNSIGLESLPSQPLTITTMAYIEPPAISSIQVLNEVSIQVEFDKMINQETGLSLSNYSINNGIDILDAAINDSIVTLTTTEHIDGDYILSISNVENIIGIPIAAESTANYSVSTIPPTESLTGYWSFNNHVNDLSPNQQHGQIFGNPSFEEGYKNDGLHLTGLDHIDFGNSLFGITETNCFSISFLIKTG